MKNIYYNCLLFLYLFSLQASSQNWQYLDTSYFSVVDSAASYFEVKFPTNNNLENTLQRIKGMFGNDPLNTFSLFRENTDALGNKHAKYQRYFNGTLVSGAVIILHKDPEGRVVSINGNFSSIVDENRTIQINAESAVNIAISLIPEETLYKWEDPQMEANLKAEKNDPEATYFPKGILLYLRDPLTDHYIPVYQIYVSSVNTEFTELIYIDAYNGQLFDRRNPNESCIPKGIKMTNITGVLPEIPKDDAYTAPENLANRSSSCNGDCFGGQGNTTLYGAQLISMGKESYVADCKFRLRENCNNVLLYTKSNTGISQNSTSNGNFDYTDQTTFFNFAVLKPGVQTHWALEQTLQFYRDNFNRSSMDGAGNDIIATNNVTAGEASFDRNTFELSFGATGGSSFTDVNGLDDVGHEFTHGVSKFEMGGNTPGISFDATGEPSSLNESFSDIFGVMISFFAKSNHGTGTSFSYVSGGEVFNHSASIPLGTCNNINFGNAFPDRDMANPKSCQQPDTRGGQFWIPPTCTTINDGGRHINAQVQNRWFVLLAEGGTGTNDLNNSYCVQKIGKDKAMRIAFDNLTNRLVANSDFNASRVGSIQSAIALFGPNSNEVAQVTAAWYAVGVGADFTGTIEVKNHTAFGLETYKHNNKIKVENFTSQSGSDVTITSNSEIAFLPTLDVKQNAIFNAFIAPNCNGNGSKISGESRIIETNEIRSTTEKENTISNADAANLISIIPNPSDRKFTLKLDNSREFPTVVSVLDALGKTILSQHLLISYDMVLDLSEYPNGLYTVKIDYIDSVIIKKIIKSQ